MKTKHQTPRGAYRVSLSDVMDREDGPFWDRMKANPDYQAFERQIAAIMGRGQTADAQAAMVAEWGPRCDEVEAGCPACAAWAMFDANGTLPTSEQVFQATQA